MKWSNSTFADASRNASTKLARYRDVLERGTEGSVVGDWIAEVDRERHSQLGQKPTKRALNAAEVKALVTRLKDIVAVLADAGPELKRTVYDELGVRLTYHPSGEVHVEAGDPHVLGVRVGGGSSTPSTYAPWFGTYLAA